MDLRLMSNNATGQTRLNPRGGMSFERRRCCSLLTDPGWICSSLAPSLRSKSSAANVNVILKRTTWILQSGSRLPEGFALFFEPIKSRFPAGRDRDCHAVVDRAAGCSPGSWRNCG